MIKDLYKAPRLFIDVPFENNDSVELNADHTHYLKNVLRRQDGDDLRIFNGRDGEYHAKITALSKKTGLAALVERLKPQPQTKDVIELYFAPIKKNRMDILIEKAVELGVSAFHPIITSRTENRKLNLERMERQVIEASEQCERLDIPKIHDAVPLDKLPQDKEIFWCIERQNAEHLGKISAKKWRFLIGPEGGFDEREIQSLRSYQHIRPISLGPQVLRAETASLACLSYACFNNTD